MKKLIYTYKKKYFFLFLNFILLLFLSSCASSKKFSDENTTGIIRETLPVRILVNEDIPGIDFYVEGSLKVSGDKKDIAIVKKGNHISVNNNEGTLSLTIGSQSFTSGSFRFSAEKKDDTFSFNGKKYNGSILITSTGKIVNVIPLEDYLKGVVPAEMPVGKDNQNYEALKAFVICARTYTMVKLNEKKPDFDLYVDVRDQVYGGVENEKQLSNKAIAETRGMVLEYRGELASVFYHSSCGGYTEDGANVFAGGNKSYLSSIKDGDDPYCSIAPKFQWEEKYSKEEFAARLLKNGLISSTEITVQSVKINSRFNSGRVNELEIDFASDSGEEKAIKIYGNQIRSIIRTADDKSILRSTLFDVDFDGDIISLTGKGYGHGVGLCQWGAIAMSHNGIDFEEILSHYFPGTEIKLVTK